MKFLNNILESDKMVLLPLFFIAITIIISIVVFLLNGAEAATQPKKTTIKYEYVFIDHSWTNFKDMENAANNLGKQGYRLLPAPYDSTSGLFFERKIEQ